MPAHRHTVALGYDRTDEFATQWACRTSGSTGGSSRPWIAAPGALVVRLSRHRVDELVAAGAGEPFAPAARTFREWVAVPPAAYHRWTDLRAEAKAHAAA
jgi:hypothetical protein